MSGLPDLLFLIPPIFLYAETHYRPRFLPSRLFKSEPEIIADAPHRLEPGQPLRVLALVKDAHHYPCTLLRVTIQVSDRRGRRTTKLVLSKPVRLTTPWWWKVFVFPLHSVRGWIDCDVMFDIENDEGRATYHNDNHVSSSRRPMRVFVSDDPLPLFRGLCFGEAHSHSHWTSDQVEFGPPPEASVSLAKALGLSYFCVTDHSYDLDDRLDSYLVNDPALPKWRALQETLDRLNRKNGSFAVVRGEEVSTRNSIGRTVHLLLFGLRNFYAGSGDGAERWFHTQTEFSVGEILTSLDRKVAAFAAHALEPVPLLQRVFLHRGEWTPPDFLHARINGIQIWNGKNDRGFESGYRLWIRQLLRGRRLVALAGDDAHGNFNRFRQVGIPLFKIRESADQLFGKVRTGVFVSRPREDFVVEALLKGRAILTDGPAVNLRRSSSRRAATSIGDSLRGRRFTFTVSTISTNEFGGISHLRVLHGEVGSAVERELLRISDDLGFRHERTFEVVVDQPSYIRAEVRTNSTNSSDSKAHFALTNPVWLDPRT